MTFDVAELPGRATQLKDKAIEVFVAMCMRGGGRGAAYAMPQYQAMAEEAFADVDSIYDRFLGCPAPEDFVSATSQLTRAMGYLATSGYTEDPVGGGSMMGAANPNLSGVSTSGDYMADWTGDAADTYNTNFADRFVPVTSNQFVLASVLRHAVNAEAAIWQTVRDDLDKLSADAITKMGECLDKSPSDWSMALTVAAAVVSVVAAPRPMVRPVTGSAAVPSLGVPVRMLLRVAREPLVTPSNAWSGLKPSIQARLLITLIERFVSVTSTAMTRPSAPKLSTRRTPRLRKSPVAVTRRLA